MTDFEKLYRQKKDQIEGNDPQSVARRARQELVGEFTKSDLKSAASFLGNKFQQNVDFVRYSCPNSGFDGIFAYTIGESRYEPSYEAYVDGTKIYIWCADNGEYFACKGKDISTMTERFSNKDDLVSFCIEHFLRFQKP